MKDMYYGVGFNSNFYGDLFNFTMVANNNNFEQMKYK